MSKRMTDDELLAAIEAEEANSYAYLSGDLANDRADALDRYNAREYGTEQPGRSRVVSSDVRDAVESIMPAIARVFLSGDEVGKFEPMDASDTGYEIETACVNWYINTRNDGYSTIYTALKDALLLGNGYIKCWWQEKQDVVVERYERLSDEELGMLLQDTDVKVVEHDEQQEQGIDPQTGQPILVTLHDVKCERVKNEEYVALSAVPPDEVIVSRTHREVSLTNADFVQHRRQISIGELRSMGYDIPDDTPGDGDFDEEDVARERFSATIEEDGTPNDITRRRVLFKETWYRGDVAGTGKQVLWRVCVVDKKIIHKEEADLIPIASFVGIIYQHSHVGVSYYSLIADLALIKTTILRQYLDGLYLQTSQRSAIDVDRVNIDDMLISRPGGLVRVTGDPGTAVMPLVTPDVGPAALQGLEYIEAVKENRTGVTRVNAGQMDPNVLSRTATGAGLAANAAQSRIELICRCLAGGVRDLFLTVHALALKHSTKPLQIRLRKQFVPVNPREWVRRTDYSISVALGTGAPEQQMAKLTAIGQFMTQGMQIGLVTPQNMYEWGVEYLKAAGYKSADRFLTQPQPGSQPPQQPNPLIEAEKIKAQSQQQTKMMELQAQAQQSGQDTQQKAALEQQRMQNELAAQRDQAEQDAALEKYKADLNADTALKSKLIDVAGQILLQSMAPEPAMPGEEAEASGDVDNSQQMSEMMTALMQTVQQLAAASGAPKRIVRGPDGRAVGVETVQPGIQ